MATISGITCWSWAVLLATDSNSTVLHFDSLSKADLSWPCGSVVVQCLTQSLTKIQWDPLLRLFACYYALCFLSNQHTYRKCFTIVWSSMLCQYILTIHFFVLTGYITSNIYTWQVDIVTLLFMYKVYLVNQNAGLYYLNQWPAGQTMISMWSMSLHMQSHAHRPFLTSFSNTAQKRIKYKKIKMDVS